MKLPVYWTAFAVRALDEIKIYIESESGSEVVARRYISKLISRTSQLSYLPESGEKEHLLQSIGQNSRYLVEGNYKIIYQFNGKSVIITDVFHTKQNPVRMVRRRKK